MRCIPWACVALVLAVAAPARPAPADADVETLRSAGLMADGSSLLAFFRARSRATGDGERLEVLVRRLRGAAREDRATAAAELLGWGPLAIPALRHAVNDPDHPEAVRLARNCLHWIQGPPSGALPAAAARLLIARKVDGTAEALLTYLPYADSPQVADEITEALAGVAFLRGKPEPALVRALNDKVAIRRAAACIALCRAGRVEAVPGLRKLLRDSSATVRRRSALALAEAGDADAVAVLIDALTGGTPEERGPIVGFLQGLAGEWGLGMVVPGDDEIACRIRRDAWANWWRRTDGPALLAALRRRTPTAADEARVRALIRNLASDSFLVRERATADLITEGPLALAQLRAARISTDLEVARRATQCADHIRRDPATWLPPAAYRLLALRRPEGAVEALLAYLPLAEDEMRGPDVQEALTTLARRANRPHPALLRALSDASPLRRAAAAEALIQSGHPEALPAARKLLHDAEPLVRLRVARALFAARQREAVPVLIDLLAVLPPEQAREAEDALGLLAGDKAPPLPKSQTPKARQQYRDAWAAWWKAQGARVVLPGPDQPRPLLGYTLVIGNGTNSVFEIDRDGKRRWEITGLAGPLDACVVAGDHVLIAEANLRRVTERDFKGKIVWEKAGLTNPPVCVQRLPNGNTFIAAGAELLEVDRTGKEVYSIKGGRYDAAYRARNGDVIAVVDGGPCVRLNTAGKELRKFSCDRIHADCVGGLDLLPNGRILIAQPSRKKVVEYDPHGRVLQEFDAPFVTTATALPNGHILVAANNRVFELDRRNKVVWEHKVANVFRARRR